MDEDDTELYRNKGTPESHSFDTTPPATNVAATECWDETMGWQMRDGKVTYNSG
jgi:predicted cobalt transporter CbtA